jgi:hypothetical protein
MRTERGLGAPSSVALSWLAAAACYPTALVAAAVGQGLGAIVGGCTWIGISLPVDRQVWALVNQPVLNFAALPAAAGYWWGSWLLPLVAAGLAISSRPRSRSWTAELVLLQGAWSAVLVAGAWLPLIEPGDGHLARWLDLHGLPTGLVWSAPAVAALVGLLPGIRTLELARRRSRDLRRLGRLTVIGVHLVAPAVLWAAACSLVRGEIPGTACLAGAAPVVAVVLLAWFRFPEPDVKRLRPPTARGILLLSVCSLLALGSVWIVGRPVAEGRRAGLLWGTPSSFNNIRTWIAARPLPETLREPTEPPDGA